MSVQLSSRSLRTDGALTANDADGHAQVYDSLFARISPGPLIYRVLITLPIAAMLSQWLLPLLQLGGDNGRLLVETLGFWAAVLLIQGMFTVRGWVWLPINILLLSLLCSRFIDTDQPLSWVVQYASHIFPEDVRTFTQSLHFTELSRETRTLILLIGWGILVSAVQMLALYRRTVWLFAASTLVYLAMLEFFVIESAYTHMAYTLGMVMLAQGMMQMLRLSQGIFSEHAGGSGDAQHRRKGPPLFRWCVAVLAAAGLVLGAGHVGGMISEPATGTGVTPQKIAETIADWAADLRNESELVQTAQMTGYDIGDADLGGALQLNDSLFFTASSRVPTYWRGDVYSRYDGRKWIPQRAVRTSVRTGVDLRLILPDWGDPDRETIVQSLTYAKVESGLRTLLSGGSIAQVTELQTASRHVPGLAVDRISNTVAVQDGRAPIAGYTIRTVLNRPQEHELRLSGGEDPAAVKDLYLQLPINITDRVRRLADEVTSGATGRYDMVSAIEAHLKQNYTYSLDTSVPPEGREFSDHFLFDTREGYCSHFATAMTVMLRAKGIPARYITGFAPGEPAQGEDEIYHVSYKDAHAWVEVYFPELGWVTFDPTPGFGLGQAPASDSDTVAVSGDHHDFIEAISALVRKTVDDVMSWLSATRPLLLFMLLLLIISAAAVAVMMMPQVRLALSFARLARHIAVSGREGLLSAAQLVLERLQKAFGPYDKGQTMRQYMASLPITDDKLRADVELFASRWERAAYVDMRWSRTEKTAFLRQCIRIVKKLV